MCFFFKLSGLKLSKLKIVFFYLLLITAICCTFIYLTNNKKNSYNSLDQINREDYVQEKLTENEINLNR